MCNCPHCDCTSCESDESYRNCLMRGAQGQVCNHDWRLVFHTYSDSYETHYYEFYCTKCLKIKSKESKDN